MSYYSHFQQILSKDKTVLQADKQLLELELADRTKKLQKIMKQSSITGTTSCSSRSSSRRSSVDSRVGRAWKDDKDAKKSKKSKIPVRDGNDGIQKENIQKLPNDNRGDHDKMIIKPSTKSTLSTPDEVLQNRNNGCSSNHGNSSNDERKTSTKSASSTTDEALQGEALQDTNHGNTAKDSNHGNGSKDISTDSQSLESNTKEDEERLQNIDDFVTMLLDLHTPENNDNDLENMRSEIKALQGKASTGNNQPVAQRQAVVAKLGALYQIMKAKKKFEPKRMQSHDEQVQTRIDIEVEASGEERSGSNPKSR